MRSLIVIALLSLSGVSHAVLPANVDGQQLPSLAPLLEQVTPAVVNINTRTRVRVNSPFGNDPFLRRFFGIPRERVSQSLGSGVIVDAANGYVLTNNHVIQGADDIQVTLHDGRTVQGERVGSDPDTDVALLRIPADGLSQLPLADSEALRVGDFVIAVGNPFGLGQTVTSGIVSALGRRALRGLSYQNFIQTDASINPGNSGGALLNLRGELVGINTAIFSPSGGNIGIGFAIPTRIATYVMTELVEYGAVRRGSMGIAVRRLSAELARQLGLDSTDGALVTRVRTGSPADHAGIEPGDVIVEFNEQRIDDPSALRNAEGLLPVGDRIRLALMRDGRRRDTDLVVTAALPREIDGDRLDARLAGTRLGELDDNLSLESGVDGVLIISVQRTSAAASAGLRPGDVIRAVNRNEVAGLEDLALWVEGADDDLLLTVLRGRRNYLVLLE